MGIHTGTAHERDDDYFGRAVNRVARLMSIAHGEQILVSGTTAALLRALEVDGLTLRDLGEHRLKDLAEPEPTFQVIADGLRTEFPPPTSLNSFPNNLPSQISSFIGRENELQTLHTATSSHRVITIAGPGGIGKTRLSLQLGAELAHEFKDGVWFVEFASLDDPKLVVQTVADALGIRELPAEQILTTVQRSLERKRLLLILDNAEHVIAEVARFTRDLTRGCPNVTLLLTSREPLLMPGEFVFWLLPLSLAVAGEPDGAELSQSDQLFLERALSVRPDIHLDDAAARTIARICRRLDGIPLAIELSAARLSSLSFSELDRRLEDRLKILVSRDRSRDERHRTLRETIDWSYRLLDDAERRFFSRAVRVPRPRSR